MTVNNFKFSAAFVVISIICFLILKTEAQPSYIYHFCPNTTYPPDSTYRANLNLLIFYLSSNVVPQNRGFYNATAGDDPPNVAHGVFLCRGDASTEACRVCVVQASNEIIKRCPVGRDAVIWYDECMIRYSNRSFLSTVDVSPALYMLNTRNITEPDRFQQVLAQTMNNLASRASNDLPNDEFVRGFAVNETNITDFQTLYGLVQCTPDLSSLDCNRCLRIAIAQLPVCCSGKRGGRVLIPSCNIRFELYPIYNIAPPPVPNSFLPPPTPTSRDNNTNATIIATSASISTFLVVVLVGVFIGYSRGRKRRKIFEREKNNHSQEFRLTEFAGQMYVNDYSNEYSLGETESKSQDFPLIRLNVIREATQQFSKENKLGEGGFGPVYKGTLVDGKEIAVKRLSRNSGQGLHEFKNEVTSISRLQHRNLVRLLGCCFEGNELLLVYDYMPNKSLDVFLFDSVRATELDWKRRFSIIQGISRGLLYLHEDSRLRIIHRDLKASNILLDHEMNPKISDFGMAKIFGGDQSEANTNRVVGTYGYMAPEYAMEGIFSVKSDVFSFGVLLLEIVSGKRNNRFHISELGESLLTFAWKLWCKGEGLTLMDPLLTQSCVATEIIKCLHIGLLCVQEDPADRPTMSSVVLMLGSDTTTLPRPMEPAFSVGRVILQTSQTKTKDLLCSINEISNSDVSPR